MAENKDFDDIPTLSDIVFPGNPEKILANKPPQEIEEPTPEPTKPHTIDNSANKPTNTYIQEEIDNIVESVLAKYFFKVRKEIVDEIMLELHKKVP